MSYAVEVNCWELPRMLIQQAILHGFVAKTLMYCILYLNVSKKLFETRMCLIFPKLKALAFHHRVLLRKLAEQLCSRNLCN
ncbi:MAG: hypothetical protein JWM44_4386 [Bacilli bacterium]|nr:hypothetical protein [Bacilli bacterium]